MKRLQVLCVLILVTVLFLSIAVAEADSEKESSLDDKECKLMLIFARLWKYSPLVEKERAAWIVRNTEGMYDSIDYPPSTQRNITVWSGPLPDGIIAQAHTHGDHLEPEPSRPDQAVAKRLKVPVYTLTRKGIWRANPDGTVVQERKRDWYTTTMKQCNSLQAQLSDAKPGD